jgi:hypothetical protein
MKREAVVAVVAIAVAALLVGGVVGSRVFPSEAAAASDVPAACVQAVRALGEEVADTLRLAGVPVETDTPEGLLVDEGQLAELKDAYELAAVACVPPS